MARIYTKNGDKGETRLADGSVVPKDDSRLEVCGSIDELNSVLGLVRSSGSDPFLDEILERIQNELFEAGADLSLPLGKLGPRIGPSHTERLEREIDRIERDLPPLRQFILPGGGRASSLLHLARTVCRRAERRAAPLARQGRCNPEVMVYLNRLSDWLFVAARYSSRREGGTETLWSRPPKEP